MPNWCQTNYVFKGSKEEIKDLHDKLKSLGEMETPLTENGFGNNWLGCVVTLFGGDWNTIACRGDFSDLGLLNENAMQLYTETAWGDLPEVWDFVLEQYPSVSYYYQAQECGNAYYATNDEEGKYFPDRYIVDQWEEGTEYYSNVKDLFRDIATRTGRTVTNKKELVEAIVMYNSDNGDNEIYVNEYSIIKRL
jgi:hypothetical protein